MQAFINFLRGSVRVRVAGAFPERFINLCAQRGVAFWELQWLDEHTLSIRVARRDVRRLGPMAERVQCEIKVERRMGAPYFAARFKKRYALLSGLFLSLAAILVLSQFILTIEVSGNETVPSSVILSELRRCGVTPGKYGPAIARREAEQQVLLALPELSWIAVNLHGTRAEVLVREREAPPALLDERTPSDVVASVGGLVTRVEVLSGAAAVGEGGTVAAGDILITGVVRIEGPPYGAGDLGVSLVHAQGRVYARTWRTLTAQIPLEAEIKNYTGQEKSRWSLTLFGHRFNFYNAAGISFPKYDKISEAHALTLPGGLEFPIVLRKDSCRAYETLSAPVNLEAAQELLQGRLEKTLLALIEPGGGEVLRMDYTAGQRGLLFEVTLVAECEEQIGKVVPFGDGAE